MRRQLKNSTVVLIPILATAVVVIPLIVRPTVVRGQAATYQAPRLPGTQNPDFNGIWQAFTTANWNLLDHAAEAAPAASVIGAWGVAPGGRGIVEGNEIPYKPEALATKKANFEGRLKIDPQNMHATGDPESKCHMVGVPRAMYLPYPFQIVQTGKEILMVFEFGNLNRLIPLNRRQEGPVEAWMGWSNGRWEGDTLVVDVTNFKSSITSGLTWFDRSGNFAGDRLRVVERYTRTGPDHLMYEATVEDPETFTRPWKISFPLYRRIEKSVQLSPIQCVDITEPYLYGTLIKKSSR